METSRQLRIAIFEKDTATLFHLHTYLSLAGHSVIPSHKEEETLETFLEIMIKKLRVSVFSPYDLLILDIPPPDFIANKQILRSLTELASLNRFPLILMTAIHQVDKKNILATLPHTHFLACSPIYITEIFHIISVETGLPPPSSSLLFEGLQQLQRHHVEHLRELEYAWLEQRQLWLNQRKEWIGQRLIWLEQRLIWINRQRAFSHPQVEWLGEQELWVQQQAEDAKQQRIWIEQLQLWINKYRRRLDQQNQPPLSQAQ